jgi:hypothetical protein
MKPFLLAVMLSTNWYITAQTSGGFTSGPVFAGCDTTGGREAIEACMQRSVSRHIGQNFTIPLVERQAFQTRIDTWNALPRRERKTTPQPELKGRIFISLIIETDGSISNIEVVKVTGELMKETQEACIYAVRTLPKFQRPAYEAGKPARMRFTFPVNVSMM